MKGNKKIGYTHIQPLGPGHFGLSNKKITHIWILTIKGKLYLKPLPWQR